MIWIVVLSAFLFGCFVGRFNHSCTVNCDCSHSLAPAVTTTTALVNAHHLDAPLEEFGWVFTSQLGNYMSYFILQEYWRAPFHHGVFIEFGCADGITNSNTYFFERYWGWTGLCIETHPMQYQQAILNRPNSHVLNLAIGSQPGVLEFWYLTNQTKMASEQWSGISEFFSPTYKEKIEKIAFEEGLLLHKVPVKLVNLTSILDKYADFIKAPWIGKRRLIDYLSVDCEGCEYEALLGLDFSRYVFSFITVELDSPSGRARFKDKIYNILLANGYQDTQAGSVDPLFKYNWDANFKSGRWPWMIETKSNDRRGNIKPRGVHNKHYQYNSKTRIQPSLSN